MVTIDAHTHATEDGVQGVLALLRQTEEQGCQACNMLSCECMGGASQNALAIFLKAYAPHCFAFGGLTYRRDMDFSAEASRLLDIGLDGVKMVENKPAVRKALGVPFNDRRYDGMYALLESAGAPLLSHMGDPEEFWDENAIPAWARAAGWLYDDTFVANETLYREAEDVLTRFPRLRVIFAHFLFLSSDLARLDTLMTRFPNLYVDIASGVEMYHNFARQPEACRAFFLKYQERILFGTDTMNSKDASELANMRVVNRLERQFLSEKGAFTAWEHTFQGIYLPDKAHRKVLSGNFLRLTGGAPRPLDKQKAAAYLRRRLDDRALALTDKERAVTRDVLDYLYTGALPPAAGGAL